MPMKRTKSINRDAFRKAFRPYRLAPVAIAITAVFALSGCEESDETVSLYMNAQECAQANPSQAAQCEDSYRTALQEAQRTAPKYATLEDCVAEFGDAQCTQTASIDGQAVSTENANNLNPDSSQMAQANSGGSFFMPLMAGYMMGRLMGVAHQHNHCLVRVIQQALQTVNLWMRQVVTMVLRLVGVK